MGEFTYKAATRSGRIIKGEMSAPSRAGVIDRLIDMGHIPLAAVPVGRAGFLQRLKSLTVGARRPSHKDIAIVTQELATLLEAGVLLERALQMAAKFATRPALGQMLAIILEDVRGGQSFAAALARYPRVFPNFYTSLVRAGEIGGALDVVMARLAEYLLSTHEMRQNIRSALVYPMVLMVMIAATMAIIFLFVLPQFEPIFADAGGALPLATQVVLAIGKFVGAYWWVILTTAAIALVFFLNGLKKPAFRLAIDRWLLRSPLIGMLIAKREAADFCRTLGLMLGNGLTLPAALAITGDTLRNMEVCRSIARVLKEVREGSDLATPLNAGRVFPAIAVEMIRVGEGSGRLDAMLLKISQMLDRDVQTIIQRLLALMVPLITILMGVIVAGLIASILVGIMSVNQFAL